MTRHHQKPKYLAGTVQVLVTSQKETKPYSVDILGKTFRVLPKVFSPKYFFDTKYFAEVFPDAKGKAVLEVGSGTGVISVFAALRGARHVTAIDINPQAVANTKLNAELHGVNDKMTILKGDLYQPLQADDRYDLIFWNTPFGLIYKRKLTNLERAVFDTEYEATTRFIEGAGQHLRPGGTLLIGFSTTLGHGQFLHQLLRASGFRVRRIQSTRSLETYPVTFDLFAAKKISV